MWHLHLHSGILHNQPSLPELLKVVSCPLKRTLEKFYALSVDKTTVSKHRSKWILLNGTVDKVSKEETVPCGYAELTCRSPCERSTP